MKPRPTQFLLMHCPAAVVHELDELCRLNYLTRTELLLIALRCMAEYLEEGGKETLQHWQRSLVAVPGDLSEEEEEDEAVLLAAEEEELEMPHEIPHNAAVEDIPLWVDQTMPQRHP